MLRLGPVIAMCSNCIGDRTSSAKPGDELLADFRQKFPEAAAASRAAALNTVAGVKTTAGNVPPSLER